MFVHQQWISGKYFVGFLLDWIFDNNRFYKLFQKCIFSWICCVTIKCFNLAATPKQNNKRAQERFQKPVEMYKIFDFTLSQKSILCLEAGPVCQRGSITSYRHVTLSAPAFLVTWGKSIFCIWSTLFAQKRLLSHCALKVYQLQLCKK